MVVIQAPMVLHLGGVLGLVLCFAACALRPVNLGAACLGMTFLVGSLLARETAAQMLSGFPAELFVVLAGVTYLFAVAAGNGTVDGAVAAGARALAGRRRWLPWGVFALAALPALCGSLGSAGIALLAPIALRLGRLHGFDARLVGLMLVHGAGAGNFSPLNVLSLVVQQAAARGGHLVDPGRLFVANLVYNLALAAVIAALLGRSRPSVDPDLGTPPPADAGAIPAAPPIGREQAATLVAIGAVALAALVFRVNVGLAAFVAAVAVQLAFPRREARAEEGVAWGVVLLVCGVVTYVSALERSGTVAAAATAIAGVGSPAAGALLVCALGAVTSAFASSAAILGALVPLALPLVSNAGSGGPGLITALALSATVVDATPFSTVGALVVASTPPAERPAVYRGLLLWGAAMVATAPPLTWLLFVVAGIGRGGP
jgi:dicarboxylate carrier protein MatC/citrate transporter